MTAMLPYVALGLAAGVCSGIVGLGGGVVIVPALVYLFKLSQHQAQGTTLAILVPPIGLLAAWTYYKQGYVDLKIAALVCVGFFLGGLLGAKLAVGMSSAALKKVFGATLLILGLKMLLRP
ncbi:MAG: sulfite exporter TauE/SafE family protein [Elusimicrobiota bacterium]